MNRLWIAGLLLVLAVPAHTAPPDPHARRAAAAAAAYEEVFTQWTSGQVPLDDVYVWSVRWRDASRDPAAHSARMQQLSGRVEAQFAVGMASALDRQAMAYYLADAAISAP
jgi:hypothetical protein